MTDVKLVCSTDGKLTLVNCDTGRVTPVSIAGQVTGLLEIAGHWLVATDDGTVTQYVIVNGIVKLVSSTPNLGTSLVTLDADTVIGWGGETTNVLAVTPDKLEWVARFVIANDVLDVKNADDNTAFMLDSTGVIYKLNIGDDTSADRNASVTAVFDPKLLEHDHKQRLHLFIGAATTFIAVESPTQIVYIDSDFKMSATVVEDDIGNFAWGIHGLAFYSVGNVVAVDKVTHSGKLTVEHVVQVPPPTRMPSVEVCNIQQIGVEMAICYTTGDIYSVGMPDLEIDFGIKKPVVGISKIIIGNGPYTFYRSINGMIYMTGPAAH
jgi:hypothetical protein